MKLSLVQQIALQTCDQQVKAALQRLTQVLTEIGVDPSKQWNLMPDGELLQIGSPNGAVPAEAVTLPQ